jgi:hypothetical protein
VRKLRDGENEYEIEEKLYIGDAAVALRIPNSKKTATSQHR